MGTLRIYGDSFSVDLGLEWQYINRLAQYLNLPVVNTSLYGCANEWILKNLLYDLMYDQIQPDDFVLVVTTSETRQWFFRSAPDVSNFNGISDLHYVLTSKEIAAVKLYVTHLQNDDLNIQRHLANSALAKSLLTAVESIGARTLTLPGFVNPRPSSATARWIEPYIYKDHKFEGSLNDVCFGEFDRMETSVKWYRAYQLPDIRANHMLKQNHAVLYNKIIDHLENGTAIDLTTGFDTGMITQTRLHQYWSYRDEVADISTWSNKSGLEHDYLQKQLLKRLDDLEKSTPDLPYYRSQNH